METMRFKLMIAALAAAATALPLGVLAQRQQTPQGAPSPAGDAQAQKARWMRDQSNWGRWGKDDELGALNLITAAKRAEALALARSGIVVSLSRPIVLTERPAAAAGENPPATPFFDVRFRSPNPPNPTGDYNVDVQSFAYHGMAYTHLDGLCHSIYEGKLYNGFAQDQVIDPRKGCQKMGIQRLKEGIVTRAVLVDFPRLRGVASLPASERLKPSDVEAWEKTAGVRVSSGDALLLYTGWKAGAQGPSANYDPSMVTLLKARGVALVGADGVSGDHQLSINALGIYLIDNADLAQAAETAARLRRWQFALVVSPIPTPGATGSIVNPLAMF